MRAACIWFILSAMALTFPADDLLAQRGGRRMGRMLFAGLSLRYQYIPHVKHGSPGAFYDRTPEVAVTTLGARLNLPTFSRPPRDREDRRRPTFAFFHSLGYNQRRIDYDDWSPANIANRLDQLHGIDYRFNLVYRQSSKWNWLIQIEPGIYSDLEEGTSGDDWKVQGALLLERVLDSGFRTGFGAVHTTAFGEPATLPLLHLESPRTARTRLRLMLPVLAELTHRTGAGFDLGAVIRVEGDQYRLGEFDTPGTIDTADKLRCSEGAAGAFAMFRFGGPWRLRLEAGGTFYRRFETMLEEVAVDDYSLPNSTYLRIGLGAGL